MASEIPLLRRLVAKVLLGMLGPAVVMVVGFGVVAHEESRLAVEEALGRRVGAAAAGAALLVLPEQIEAIAAHDEGSRTYARLMGAAARAKSTLDVRRVVFVARDLTGRADTEGKIPLGAVAHELRADAVEIERAVAGTPAASPLFLGEDGRPYKRAYAAIGEAGRGVVGFAMVEASADALAPLRWLRRALAIAGLVGLSAIMLFGLLMARRLTRPLGRLAAAAARIGGGDLTNAVPVETRDEVGQLARELDRMRVALHTRDERLQMMLAGIAHEVRNPLGGLQLYAGLLRESLHDPERLADIARIEREVKYLEAVVTDFLEYARRPHPQLAPVPAAELFHEVVEVAGGLGAPVRVEVEPDLCLEGDRSQLRRALVNLVRNALQAAGPAGQVVVAARRDAPGRVLCEVRDSGLGVPEEVRGKIFEPFFTTREKGTGLGLAFVREIVRDHGGDVRVDRAPEGGARFQFDVPGR